LHTLIRKLVPLRAKQLLRRSAWQQIRLTWKLSSGLIVPIRNDSEWHIYNEIFVNCIYDAPTLMALAGTITDREFIVVDLGANVGLFSLRAAHLIRSHGVRDWKLTAIEGNPETARQLSDRLLELNQLGEHICVINGLVGERSGDAIISNFGFAGNNRIIQDASLQAVRVAYVDLEAVLPNGPLDLLKCDIEGSELSFVTRYGDLLRRVKVAVFELHESMCDTQQCRTMLRTVGFDRQNVVAQEPGLSTIYFWRTDDAPGLAGANAF
jgi:FkbM family methyltransferase